MQFQINPNKLNEYAMNYDPFPLLAAINNSVGQEANFVTTPGVGATSAPTTGGSFSTMLTPAKAGAPTSAPNAPMSPDMMKTLMSGFQQQAPQVPHAPTPRPMQPVNLQPKLPAGTPATSFASILRRA